MNVLFLESFFGGSHKNFAEGFCKFWRGRVDLVSLPARFWKWRVRGAAFEFIQRIDRSELSNYDLMVVTSLTSIAELKAFWSSHCPPVILYMHESQLDYPMSKGQALDMHFVINDFSNCLHADKILFNSATHRDSYLYKLSQYLDKLPDFTPTKLIDQLLEKTCVAHPGCHFEEKIALRPWHEEVLTILWNHRWEHDKCPEDFFNILNKLKSEKVNFRLRVLGESYRSKPRCFDEARVQLADCIDHWGFVDSVTEYYQHLANSHIIISTAIQENFGISVVEAMRYGCYPLLPKRLSYPEILPTDFHEDCLYESLDELKTKLTNILRKPFCYESASQKISEKMTRYSWDTQINRFHELLGTVGDLC